MAEVDIYIDEDSIVLKGEDDEGRPFQVRLGDEAILKLAMDLAEAGFKVFRRSAGHDRTAKPLVVLRDGRVGVGTVNGKLYVDIAGGAVVLGRAILTDAAGRQAAGWIREVLDAPVDARTQKRRH